MASKRARNAVSRGRSTGLFPGVDLGSRLSFGGLAGHQCILGAEQIGASRREIARGRISVCDQRRDASTFGGNAIFGTSQGDLGFNGIGAQPGDFLISSRNLCSDLLNEDHLRCAAFNRFTPVPVGQSGAFTCRSASNADNLCGHQQGRYNACQKSNQRRGGERNHGGENNRSRRH